MDTEELAKSITTQCDGNVTQALIAILEDPEACLALARALDSMR